MDVRAPDVGVPLRLHAPESKGVVEAIVVFERQIEDLQNGPEPDAKKINALYRILIKPTVDQLVNGEPVIFIPHEVCYC